jgi:hypothetical protein
MRSACVALILVSVAIGSVVSTQCEDPDPCSATPCLNGGQCSAVPANGNRYTCDCPDDYIGFYCEEKKACKDPCDPSPCRNSGTCKATGVDGGASHTRYQCTCVNGYRGFDCEIAPDPCSPNPCVNFQQCTPVPSNGKQYTCTCPPHYGGCSCNVAKPDACPDGFQSLTPGKSCFKVILTTGTYDQEVAKCNALHPLSDLAVITSQAEQDTIAKNLQGLTQAERDACGYGFYIGLGRKDKDHCPASSSADWVWKSVALCGDPIIYINWGAGQPDGCNGIAQGGTPRESCGHIWPATGYRWNDLSCSTAICGVCSIAL